MLRNLKERDYEAPDYDPDKSSSPASSINPPVLKGKSVLPAIRRRRLRRLPPQPLPTSRPESEKKAEPEDHFEPGRQFYRAETYEPEEKFEAEAFEPEERF